jgi:glycerol-3-phosphate dehydrogenase (NAD(P)+)
MIRKITDRGGPCDAQELAMQTNAYVTVATKDVAAASRVANIINVKYIQTNISTDSFGIAFAAVLKNSIGIATGIANGLHYGENFRGVFTSNTMRRQPQYP